MPRRRSDDSSLMLEAGQAIIGFNVPGELEDVTQYVVEDSASESPRTRETLEAALAMIGAWRHLDWEAMIEELDQRRHESEPTPPIDL